MFRSLQNHHQDETCSLPFNKYDVPDVNDFIILIINILAHRDVFNQTSHSSHIPHLKLTVVLE
jgi:hypothetical protein